jgi:LysR family transcriptional regulator for metE and metH
MRHLQLVRAIADCGTLTQAGLALHLTQSALSHQLRDIESRLGVRLFDRAGRRLALTPAGRTLLAAAADVLAIVERTEDAIRQEGGHGRLLRLTTECYTCYHWLPGLLRDYERAHPDVEVRIDVSATDRPVPALVEGQIDLALVSDRARDRRIQLQPLFQDEYAVVMHPAHKLAHRPFVTASDFATETFLSYSPREQSTVYQRLLKPAHVAPARVLQVRLTEAIIEMAKAGLGIGVLSRWAVQPHVSAGTLSAVPLTRSRFGRTWSAATLKQTAVLPHIRDFIALLAVARPFDMPTPSRALRTGPSRRVHAAPRRAPVRTRNRM